MSAHTLAVLEAAALAYSNAISRGGPQDVRATGDAYELALHAHFHADDYDRSVKAAIVAVESAIAAIPDDEQWDHYVGGDPHRDLQLGKLRRLVGELYEQSNSAQADANTTASERL